jgi:23S rRNA (adenine2503-C2)-methyltransferase
MNVAVNLTCAEILDQVIQAKQLLLAEGRGLRNVVFMGMGEPLHNEEAVHAALELLLSPQHFALSPAHVLVSTVGIPAALVRCARRFPRVGLAVSLHSARQEVRERLIPLARRYPVDQLRAAMEEVTALRKRALMVEYMLLDGVNDGNRDAEELCAYLRGLPVHINLIPYNPIAQVPPKGCGEDRTMIQRHDLEAAELRGTPEPRQRQFADALKGSGYTVTVRYSLGKDIAAACGQLVRHEMTRPSV